MAVRTATRPTRGDAGADKNGERTARATRRAFRSALKQREAELLSGDLSRKLSPAEARRIVDEGFRLASETIRAGSRPLAATPRAAVEAAEADITNELEKGGPAFGAFVKSVGLAVAEAQQKLDETLVTTAKALSDTKIDVIAVFEQQINDDGQMTAGKTHLEKMPIVNYLMPTAYQWTRVFLQADMKVQEFNGANGFNIKGKSYAASANVKAGYSLFGGFGASGSASASTSGYEAAGETSVARDDSAGSLHMEATLEPRADVQLPRPFVLQKGPKLKVTAGSRTEIMSADTPPKVTGRQLVLTCKLDSVSGGPIGDEKQVEFKVSDPLIDYDASNGGKTTGGQGKVTITLKREGAAFDEKKPPEPVVVRVWFGLINEQVVVNL